MAHRHKVHKAAGGKITHEAEEKREEKEAGLKRGGAAYKAGGKVPGKKCGGRLDKRARGGGVGADKHPFSSAHLK